MKKCIVDTAAIRRNAEILKSLAGSSEIWAVVKGDGYGLGLEAMAGLLYDCGIRRFAVSEPDEAERLTALRVGDIKVLFLQTVSDAREAEKLLKLGVIFTVGTAEEANALIKAAERLGLTAEAHIKLDTGMGRCGFLPSQLDEFLPLYTASEALHISGLYTHFSKPQSRRSTKSQFKSFMRTAERIKRAGLDPGLLHCAGSEAFLRYPEMRCGAVRLGSAFLGRVSVGGCRLKNAVRCIGSISELRVLPKGHGVGYGSAWRAPRDTRVALCSIGYYNGFGLERGCGAMQLPLMLRRLFGAFFALLRRDSLWVEVRGQRCPVLGRVGMMSCVIDVSGCCCEEGDAAVADINPLILRGFDIIFK